MDFDAAAYRERIRLAADALRSASPVVPEAAIVLGSGLGPLADAIGEPSVLPYDRIPGFPKATVPGHEGRFVFGRLAGRPVVAMQGRFHHYEGHDIHDVVLPVRVLSSIGVRTLVLTNAAGGMGPGMAPGCLMVIDDHIGLFADSPLRGANLDEFGPRFLDVTRAYDKNLADLAYAVGQSLDLPVHRGIYAYCKGPQFETPAEIRLLQALGASAAGMSTVPEAIAARHGGMRVLGVSCITNLAAGLSSKPLDHEEVLEVGRLAADGMIRMLTAVIGRMGGA